MKGIEKERKRWHVVKTFETEVSFDVEAETYDEVCQKALEADINDDLDNKSVRVSDESVRSINEHMPTWHFTVWERMQRGVSVEAPNEEEARRMICDIYKDGGILLDDHDKTTQGFYLDERPDNPNDDKPDWWYAAPDEEDGGDE